MDNTVHNSIYYLIQGLDSDKHGKTPLACNAMLVFKRKNGTMDNITYGVEQTAMIDIIIVK